MEWNHLAANSGIGLKWVSLSNPKRRSLGCHQRRFVHDRFRASRLSAQYNSWRRMYLTEFDQQNHQISDQLFAKYETDKRTGANDYARIYSRLFHEIRNMKIKFHEIGIDRESSVRTWEEYFSNAELNFIDRSIPTNSSSRSRYYKILLRYANRWQRTLPRQR